METFEDDKATNSLSRSQIDRIQKGWKGKNVFSGFAAVVEGPKKDRTILKFSTVGPDWTDPKIGDLTYMGEYCFGTAISEIRSQGAEPKFALDYITCDKMGEEKDQMLDGILNMSEFYDIPIVGGEVSIHEGGIPYCIVFLIGW